MDAIFAREKKKDQEFSEVQARCEEALRDLEKNPLVQDLRADMMTSNNDILLASFILGLLLVLYYFL